MFHFTRNLCLLSSVVRISLITVHRFDSWASIFLVGTLKTSVVHRDTLVELIKWATFLLYLFFVFNTNAFRCSLWFSLNIAHCVNQLFGNVTMGQINLILFQGNSIPSIVEYINYCTHFQRSIDVSYTSNGDSIFRRFLAPTITYTTIHKERKSVCIC